MREQERWREDRLEILTALENGNRARCGHCAGIIRNNIISTSSSSSRFRW